MFSGIATGDQKMQTFYHQRLGNVHMYQIGYLFHGFLVLYGSSGQCPPRLHFTDTPVS